MTLILTHAARALDTTCNISATLQAVSLHIPLSPYYLALEVSPDVVERVVEKWLTRYPELTASTPERTALRKYGYPAPTLLIYPYRKTRNLQLFLLCNTPLEGESLQHVESTPLVWLNYRLERVEKKSAMTWSWGLVPEVFTDYHRMVSDIVLGRKGRNASDTLTKLFEHLSRYAGFAGINRQRKTLVNYAQQMWVKHTPKHKEDGTPLPAPTFTSYPYLRRITWYGDSLGEVMDRFELDSSDDPAKNRETQDFRDSDPE